VAKTQPIFKILALLERARKLLQNPYKNVHHTYSMLLHYFGKLEIQIWWKLHCVLKNTFYLSFNSVKS